MKSNVQLSTQQYYDQAVREEVSALRRQKGKEALQEFFFYSFLVLTMVGSYIGFATGAFDGIDVLGTCQWIGEQVKVAAVVVDQSIKSMFA